MKIGIVGGGVVGQATRLLETPDHQVCIYDLRVEKCSPVETSLQDVADCEVIFICLPTPATPNGSTDTSCVEDCISEVRQLALHSRIGSPPSTIVVRSTIPMGTAEALKVCHMPEFLTETRALDDFAATRRWILGVPHPVASSGLAVQRIRDILSSAHRYGKIASQTLCVCSNSEAELVKYYRNCFLALKVSFCNEIEQFCRRTGVDYETVREMATADPRIGRSHTEVPGPDGQRGYGGKCFPKDMRSLVFEMQTLGMDAPVLAGAIKRNTEEDRLDPL